MNGQYGDGGARCGGGGGGWGIFGPEPAVYLFFERETLY